MSRRFVLPHEARPRDFVARYSRARPRRLGAMRAGKQRGRMALLLVGAIALPALAAPDAWDSFAIGNAGETEIALEPMPFEKPGSSFPGSAFYYLAADHEVVDIQLDQGAHWDHEALAPGASQPEGPAGAAQSMRMDNSGIDRSRALQCLTAGVYYEAANEPDSGQRAVAQVILNRVAHPAYPNTVCGVVFQGSERRTGCQFSFTCDGSLARRPNPRSWLRSEAVALAALGGYVHAPVGLATHYHATYVSPYWAPSLTYLGTIGLHRFYKFGGKAGQSATFRFAYAAGEPMAAPHPRSQAANLETGSTIDPVAVQAAYDAGFKSAQAAALGQGSGLLGGGSRVGAAAHPSGSTPTPGMAPTTAQQATLPQASSNLPQSHGIRPEYQNSGRWIVQPGT